MTDKDRESFQEWLESLRALSAERGLDWVIDQSGAVHREAFEAGRTPESELQILADLAEWRGCGCGGA